MDVSQLIPATNSPQAVLDAASDMGAEVNSDFEMFLRMLTVQMQNQDPLNPVDSTDYATQLATFSGVEQAVLTNDLLKSLTTQMNTGGLVDMAALVGKEVRSSAPAFFDGQPIALIPQRSVVADTAELVVRNEAGDEVQRLPIQPAAETVQWAGVGPGGTPMPAGLYQFEIVGKINNEIVAQDAVDTYSTVTEVRLDGGQTTLILSGGASIASDDVTALREGSS